MLRRIALVVSSTIWLAACQTVPPQEPSNNVLGAPGAVPSEAVSATISAEPEPLPPPVDLWDRIRRDLRWHDVHNAQIGKARDQYLAQPDYFPVVAERASLYLYYIVEEVEKRGMPMEIALLPLVESTINPFATSSEGAAGLWQIMPATGRYLGVESNWWYDGKRDLRESTDTALDYLERVAGEVERRNPGIDFYFDLAELRGEAVAQGAGADVIATWPAYREARCGYVSARFGPGSGEGPAWMECRMRVTAEHVIWLQGLAVEE